MQTQTSVVDLKRIANQQRSKFKLVLFFAPESTVWGNKSRTYYSIDDPKDLSKGFIRLIKIAHKNLHEREKMLTQAFIYANIPNAPASGKMIWRMNGHGFTEAVRNLEKDFLEGASITKQ